MSPHLPSHHGKLGEGGMGAVYRATDTAAWRAWSARRACRPRQSSEYCGDLRRFSRLDAS